MIPDPGILHPAFHPSIPAIEERAMLEKRSAQASIPKARRSSYRSSVLLVWALTLAACGGNPPEEPSVENSPTLDTVAEQYVRLVLAVGQHDSDYVDAYYGPEDWREAAQAEERTLDDLKAQAEGLVEELSGIETEDEMEALRHRYLERQLQSLAARVSLLGGATLTFDEESRALYDAEAPHHEAQHFEALVAEAEAALAEEGFTEGPFIERLEAFRKDFIIPRDQLDAVFSRAIDACRERTAEFLELPEGENFVVEYVEDKPWSGYNWYQGGFQSLIQVNTDLPIFVDRAIDLACHEGYPGHHLYNSLLEKHLVRDRGWVEYSVYALFSPQSLIAEGSANYGIEMAFPGEERIAFEREELFPLAGLDASRAEAYYRIQDLVDRLGYAGNEAARRYLDGNITADEAVDWLSRYAAMSPERAQQRVSFIEKYRSYVINYNLGQDMVRAYVEAQTEGADATERWRIFGELLSSPRLPSDLR